MSISVVVWPGLLECACCGYEMRTEKRARTAREAVITCPNFHCEQYEMRMAVKAQILECEELPV